MEISKYIACICEGTAEEVIIDILLHNDKLIFTKISLLRASHSVVGMQRHLNRAI